MTNREASVWTFTTGIVLLGILCVAGTKPVLAASWREVTAMVSWLLTLLFALFLAHMWDKAGQLPAVDVAVRERLP